MTTLRHRTRNRLAAAVMVVALVVSACGSSNPLGGGSASGDLKSVVVGSADFPESKILAEIYAQALEANGFTVGRQLGIGSRETYIPALQDHSIDLIPEYTGNLLKYFDPKATATSPPDVELALFRALPGDLSMLTPSPAADVDTVAVTAATAQKWNLKTIGDLARPFGGGEIRCAVGVPEPGRGPARSQGELRARHLPSRTSWRSATAAAPRRCGRSSTAPSPRPTSSPPHRPSRRTTSWC